MSVGVHLGDGQLSVQGKQAVKAMEGTTLAKIAKPLLVWLLAYVAVIVLVLLNILDLLKLILDAGAIGHPLGRIFR